MRHLTHVRPGHRQPITVTDPDTGRVYLVPQGGDENDGDDDQEDEESDEDDDSGDDEGQDDDGEGDGKKFTQADLDKAINERIARERKKHERALRAAQRKTKTEGGRTGDDGEATKKANARAVKAEARAAAIAAGVPKDRAARFVGLADLDDIESLLTDDGDVDEAAIEALVEDTLEEWPEFKPTEKGKAGASGAEGHGGEKRKTKVWTRSEIAELSEKEYEEHREEIQDQIRRGLVK